MLHDEIVVCIKVLLSNFSEDYLCQLAEFESVTRITDKNQQIVVSVRSI